MTHPKPDVTSLPSPEAAGDALLSVGGRFRHKKRGEAVTIVGSAFLQSAQPVGDMTPVAVYRADDGSLWVRPGLEFLDGRFEPIASPSPPSPVPSSVSGEMVNAACAAFFTPEAWDRIGERGAEPEQYAMRRALQAALAVPRPSPSGQYGELVKRLRHLQLRIDVGDLLIAVSALGHPTYENSTPEEAADALEAADARILVLEAERDTANTNAEAWRLTAKTFAASAGASETERMKALNELLAEAYVDAEKAESRCAELEKRLEALLEEPNSLLRDGIKSALASLPASDDEGNNT